jgi:hypothetical protein
MLMQGCANPGLSVVRETKFSKVAPDICIIIIIIIIIVFFAYV